MFDSYSPFGYKNSPEYLDGFNDGYKVAIQVMKDSLCNMKPFTTSMTTSATSTAQIESEAQNVQSR